MTLDNVVAISRAEGVWAIATKGLAIAGLVADGNNSTTANSGTPISGDETEHSRTRAAQRAQRIQSAGRT